MIIYPGDLDLYDRWRAHENDPDHHLYLSDDDLVARLQGSTGQPSIVREGAFKNALTQVRKELGYPHDTVIGWWGKTRFDFDFRSREYELVKFRNSRTKYRAHFDGHVVEGWVDGLVEWMRGIIVSTTDGPIELEPHFDSWQWRAALAGFAHPNLSILYELFRIRWAGGNRVKVEDFKRVEMFPYHGLREELEQAVREFTAIMGDMGWRGR